MIDPGKYTRPELLMNWKTSIEAGTFLTGKHDVLSVGSLYPRYRTVSMLDQPRLREYLASGEYELRLYENHKQSASPLYFEIVPNDPNFIPGSGIQANSNIPTDTCDRFIVVSGIDQGWHLFAERDSEIRRRCLAGDLVHLGDLKK